MKRVTVEIAEVHKSIINIDVPENIDREAICELAKKQFEEEGEEALEYSHTLDESEWTVRDENGNYI